MIWIISPPCRWKALHLSLWGLQQALLQLQRPLQAHTHALRGQALLLQDGGLPEALHRPQLPPQAHQGPRPLCGPGARLPRWGGLPAEGESKRRACRRSWEGFRAVLCKRCPHYHPRGGGCSPGRPRSAGSWRCPAPVPSQPSAPGPQHAGLPQLTASQHGIHPVLQRLPAGPGQVPSALLSVPLLGPGTADGAHDGGLVWSQGPEPAGQEGPGGAGQEWGDWGGPEPLHRRVSWPPVLGGHPPRHCGAQASCGQLIHTHTHTHIPEELRGVGLGGGGGGRHSEGTGGQRW